MADAAETIPKRIARRIGPPTREIRCGGSGRLTRARIVERMRRAADQRCRSRELGVDGSDTYREWIARVAAHRGAGADCGRIVALEADHRTPLARGGTNDSANIWPAGRPCNLHKHALADAEFRARLAKERRARS